MGWIVRDYNCICGTTWEDVVDSKETSQLCPDCGTATPHSLSAPGAAVYSMLSQDDKAKCLRKRSRDHTKAQLKKDPTALKTTKHRL